MGSNPSLPSVTEVGYNRNFSVQHGVSEWTKFEPKNSDYYSGVRSFKVSRSLYPHYKRGWMWGYYVDYSWKDYGKVDVCTDCGKESGVWCEHTGSCPHCCGVKNV